MTTLRPALRLLGRDKAFTAVAVLVLGLGIGANTAVFSLVNALLLKPLPSRGPGIAGILTRDTTRPDSYRDFSYQEFVQVRDARDVFDAVMAHASTIVGKTEGDATREIFTSVVTSGFFSTLRVRLAAGREFTAEEERPGSDIPALVVSHEFVRKAGLAPADALGKTVRLNARDFTIVGVTQEGFTGIIALMSEEFWLPTGVYASVVSDVFRGASTNLNEPSTHALVVVGRLRPGLTLDTAAPLLATVNARMREQDPAGRRNQVLSVHRLSRLSISNAPQEDTEVATLSMMLMGMAALVLLVACLNVTNMLLARGTARRKEIAIRLALGAKRRVIVAQLLTESVLIAAAGAVAGLLLAIWGTTLLVSTLRPLLPMSLTFDVVPDWRVLGATTIFALVSTLLAGLGPAWRATKPDVAFDLKEQLGGGTAGRLRTRQLLVIGQIAVSLALLTVAGLFVRGALKAASVDPGFAVDGELLASIDPSLARYDEARGRAAVRGILQRVRATPGVHSASLASIVPFGGVHHGALVQHAGTAPAPPGEREPGVSATYMIVGSDYFETVRVPILRGRAFSASEEDSPGAPPVAVIDEVLATQLFGGDDPIGRQIQLRHEKDADVMTVIGVTSGFRQDLFDRTLRPHVFVPYGRNYRAAVHIHVRLANPTAAAETQMLQTVRREIRAADDRVPVIALKTLRQHRDEGISLWAVSTGARLFAMFGAVALLLAVVGVYGLKSYVVSRRTREMGIRMALGATPRDVVWLVVHEGLWLTSAGLALGILAAVGLGRIVGGLVYEVNPLDPLVFAVAPALLTVSALLASYLPARRAAHIVPTRALRHE